MTLNTTSSIAPGFPPILSVRESPPQLRLFLDISSESEWFHGHFPGNPVLAGVVQLHWAVRAAMANYDFNVVPYEVARLKFRNIITPPSVLELVLEKMDENEVKFEFADSEKTYSLGTLKFKYTPPC